MDGRSGTREANRQRERNTETVIQGQRDRNREIEIETQRGSDRQVALCVCDAFT